MPPTTKYRVRVWYDTPGARDGGLTFGPFDSKQAAEQCLTALAGRGDVKAAQIEEIA